MTQNIKNFIEEGEKELMNLKCVNGAMYFGSVEDDSCNCTTRCENEQTFEHATEELKQFISSRQISLIKMIVEEIQSKVWESKNKLIMKWDNDKAQSLAYDDILYNILPNLKEIK